MIDYKTCMVPSRTFFATSRQGQMTPSWTLVSMAPLRVLDCCKRLSLDCKRIIGLRYQLPIDITSQLNAD
jgi:hypothetical protein